MDYSEIVKKQANLKEGGYIIEKLLAAVYFYGPMSTKELSRRLLLPIPVTAAIKNEFIKLGVLERKSGVAMTEMGASYFLEAYGYKGMDEFLYRLITGGGAEQAGFIRELAREYREIFDSRPDADVAVDQAKCTAETSFKRAVLCLESFSLIGKRVLCVGDDDFVSVAMALLLKKLFPDKGPPGARIQVLDIDPRFIGCIDTLTNKKDLPIDCAEVDLREPLPPSLIKSFDCFLTDPPYTLDGLSLFLSRGISALKPEKGLKVFLSFGQKQVNENYSLQECVLAHGLAIKGIYGSFNQYEGASLLGNISQMMILETTDLTRPSVPFSELFTKSIYTGEGKRRDK